MGWTGVQSRNNLWQGRPHLPYESQTLFLQKDHWRCGVRNPYGMCLYQRELFSVETEVLAVIKKMYKNVLQDCKYIHTLIYT